jgi:hypothetical protein
MEPLPDLFDEPITQWLPRTADGTRGNSIELEHLLDRALAAVIRGTASVSPARLRQWTSNIREHASSKLPKDTYQALVGWLDQDATREIALFDEFLAEDDPTTAPWIVTNSYIRTTQRYPSAAIIRHLTAKAAEGCPKPSRYRLLEIAVDLARRPEIERDVYWETYDRLIDETACESLIERLVATPIDDWRREDALRAFKERGRQAAARAKNTKLLSPLLGELSVGRLPNYLHWAARSYFEGTQRAGVQRLVQLTNQTVADAIFAGWVHLATTGLGEIDAARLGSSEAEGRPYYVELSVTAGLDMLISDDRLPALSSIPIEVAIAVLKSAWQVSDQERRTPLEKLAFDRINLEPQAGAIKLAEFWGVALDSGAGSLATVGYCGEAHARGEGVAQALASLLRGHPGMLPDLLRAALTAAAEHLERRDLLAVAGAALGNTSVTGTQRSIWNLVAFTLNPASRGEVFVAEYGGESGAALFDENLNQGLVGALRGLTGVDRLRTDAVVVRLFGKAASPEDYLRGGWVTAQQRLSRKVVEAIESMNRSGRGPGLPIGRSEPRGVAASASSCPRPAGAAASGSRIQTPDSFGSACSARRWAPRERSRSPGHCRGGAGPAVIRTPHDRYHALEAVLEPRPKERRAGRATGRERLQRRTVGPAPRPVTEVPDCGGCAGGAAGRWDAGRYGHADRSRTKPTG